MLCVYNNIDLWLELCCISFGLSVASASSSVAIIVVVFAIEIVGVVDLGFEFADCLNWDLEFGFGCRLGCVGFRHDLI